MKYAVTVFIWMLVAALLFLNQPPPDNCRSNTYDFLYCQKRFEDIHWSF